MIAAGSMSRSVSTAVVIARPIPRSSGWTIAARAASQENGPRGWSWFSVRHYTKLRRMNLRKLCSTFLRARNNLDFKAASDNPRRWVALEEGLSDMTLSTYTS